MAETCRELVKRETNWGHRRMQRCGNPIHLDGMYKRHYNKKQIGDVPWGKRANYREITEPELVSGDSIKLKTDTKNKLYRYKQGRIFQFKESAKVQWVETAIDLDRTLFCIKK